ncbi:rod shape-determining protein [Facklamia hominis]|uniref:rod shape-determining protein n=1 Tax=Facklamia hominis TaxID=178214 RepID=UPI00035278ED|nr:rod shape-determining protein [Facklamia hominis]EPH13310.1 MreB/Mrl family cell shape determining protein [Facklamia hominis ACS-120-V-Sch10]
MARDIGIDLGTVNVLIYLKGRGIVLNEPAMIAYDKDRKEVLAVGSQAFEMRGRAPESIEVVQPLKGGVIADYDLTEAMLSLFFKKLQIRHGLFPVNVLVSIPSSISEIERLSLFEAVEKVSKGNIEFEYEPYVAAVGAGQDVLSPKGSMVIDIGGGTTDVAILTSGNMLYSDSRKLAGDDLDEAIQLYLKETFQLLVGLQSVERIKKDLASALFQTGESNLMAEIKGRDLLTGLPRAMNIHTNDLLSVVEEWTKQIAEIARGVLEQAPPEIMSDIHDQGIVLTGGGALVRDIETYLSDYLQVTVMSTDQPMNAVALGTGTVLEWISSGKVTPSSKNKWNNKKENLLIRFFKRLFV